MSVSSSVTVHTGGTITVTITETRTRTVIMTICHVASTLFLCLKNHPSSIIVKAEIPFVWLLLWLLLLFLFWGEESWLSWLWRG